MCIPAPVQGLGWRTSFEPKMRTSRRRVVAYATTAHMQPLMQPMNDTLLNLWILQRTFAVSMLTVTTDDEERTTAHL